MSVSPIDYPSPTAASSASSKELPKFASWSNLVIAALIYVCTNPGRTQGLGLITEPLIEEFNLSRTGLGQINFWATMIVAVLSVSFGTIVDKLGSYRASWILTALTACATAFTAYVHGPWGLFAAITLARLFGQGVLAIVSTGILGKSFRPNFAPIAASIYLALTALFYAGIVQWVRLGLVDWDWSWRDIWLGLAFCMAVVTFLSLFFTSEPTVKPPNREEMKTNGEGDRTVFEAIRHPLFIVFGLYCLFFGMAAKGTDVFMESLLKDRGFSKDVFFDSVMIGVLSLILFKFAVAWLCRKWNIGKVLAIGMLISSFVIAWTAFLNTALDVYLWSLTRSMVWSIYVVVYFSIWVYAFGRRDLAQIQSAIHVVTISSSGLGPLVLGYCRDQLGSYIPILYVLAVIVFFLGVLMLFVKVPVADNQATKVL